MKTSTDYIAESIEIYRKKKMKPKKVEIQITDQVSLSISMEQAINLHSELEQVIGENNEQNRL